MIGEFMVHLVLSVAVALALLGWNKNKNLHKMAFVLLFLFAALRYMYGNDYLSYFAGHTYIHRGEPTPYKGELLFTLLNQLCPSFFTLTVVTSAIYVFAIYRLMSRNLPGEMLWVSLFIFLIHPALFLVNLSALRQSLAVVMFIQAVDAAYQKKPGHYVLFVVLAAMFHKSAWLLLPVYFYINPRRVKAPLIFAILGAVLVLLFVVDLTGILQVVVRWFNDPNYVYYLENEQQNTIRATLLTALYFIYTLFNLPKLEGKALVYGKLYLLSTILGVFAFKVSMLTRIQMYFDIFSVIALPQIFMAVQKKGPIVVNHKNVVYTLWECCNKYLMPLLLVAVYFLRYYSFFINPMWESYVHYKSIFIFFT